jgi:hypothetical protein
MFFKRCKVLLVFNYHDWLESFEGNSCCPLLTATVMLSSGIVVYWPGLAVHRIYPHPLTGSSGLQLSAITSRPDVIIKSFRMGFVFFKVLDL